MADVKKLVSLENLTSYDTLIKKYVTDADAVVNAKSVKTVLVDGDNIKFYKKENATTADAADYTVAIASSDVNTLKDLLDGYTGKGSVKAAVDAAQSDVDDLETFVGSLPTGATSTTVTAYVAEAVKALEDGQVKTNKEAIDAINDSTTGILKTAKDYTDTEVKKVTDSIGTVPADSTVMAEIGKVNTAVGTEKSRAEGVEGTLTNLTTDAKTNLVAAINEVDAHADSTQSDLDTLEAAVGDMSKVKTTAKTVAGAVDELKDAIDATGTSGKVSIDTTTTTTGMLKSYTFYQGEKTDANKLGVIDIPKDYLVKSAELKTVETADTPYAGAKVGDKYIDFVINTKDASATDEHLYIPVNDLFDSYTSGSQATDKVVITVDNTTNTISASVTAGAIGTTELADAAVTTVKVADKNITKDKLSDGVQASLDAADAAAGALTAAIEALDADITSAAVETGKGVQVEVKEVDGKITEVVVTGNYASTYDAIGSAKAVQDDLDTYKYTVATSTEISDLFKDKASE